MDIRRYQPADCAQVMQLFYDTVHTVNARDYTPEQLDAWAPRQADAARWAQMLAGQVTYVAEEGADIIGFGNIDSQGLLDCLYVHRAHQGRGVATALVERLLETAHRNGNPRVVTHASRTARPFFLHRGFAVLQAQTVERGGVQLENFVMEKQLCMKTEGCPMGRIDGIHHIALKCMGTEAYARTLHFYTGVLGLTVARQWPEGTMLDTGSGMLEIFCTGTDEPVQGPLRHLAFATKDVDGRIEAVRAAGYTVMTEPKDIVIPSNPPYPARIAFCIGPLGEHIEFFQER